MSVSLNWGNSSILNPQYGLVVAGRVNITKIFLCAFRISTGVDTAQVRLAVPSCYLGYLLISRTEPCLLILGPCHNTGCTLKYTSPARVRLHTQICYLSHTSPAQRESSSGIKRAQADVRAGRSQCSTFNSRPPRVPSFSSFPLTHLHWMWQYHQKRTIGV